jgi:hypothetical protein
MEPWTSRLEATRWLTVEALKNGSEVSIEKIRGAQCAQPARDHAFEKIALETEAELKRLRSVLLTLQGLEREAHQWARPTNLQEVVNFPPAACSHWSQLRALKQAAQGFEASFLAGRPVPLAKRAKGERASNDSKAADNRYVAALFASVVGRHGKARDLAITEIAMGRAARCEDAAEFRERCKRWSKNVTKRRPK